MLILKQYIIEFPTGHYRVLYVTKDNLYMTASDSCIRPVTDSSLAIIRKLNPDLPKNLWQPA